MAKQKINPGTAPTGAGGDTFRSGSAKLQANDDEIYAQLGGTGTGNATLPAALPIAKGGTGATTAAAARTALGLGSAALGTLTASNVDSIAGRVLKVGDLGFGAKPRRILAAHDGTTQIYTTNGTPPAGYGGPWSQTLFMASDGVAGDGIYISLEISNGVFRIGGIRNGGVLPERTIYDNKNTTVDSNGFIKAASPVVNLHADRIELNDEAKLQEISFEKLEIGDYLIKGSSGFAQEGWYVETPKDANGNVLFSVLYDTLENGDISVKTYKKKFDLETASIVADLDKPVDITEGRWISLRLQELPQTEIEVVDEPEQ